MHGTTSKITQIPFTIAYYYRKVAISRPKHQGLWSDAIQPFFRTGSFFLSIVADRPATSLLTVHRCRWNNRLLPVDCHRHVTAIELKSNISTPPEYWQFEFSSVLPGSVCFIYLFKYNP